MAVSSWSSSSRHCSKSNGTSSELKLCSYKLINESFAAEMDYEGEDVFCFCGLKSPRRCSWTGSNPGRRFYGCQKYPVDPCRFMRWHDEVFSSRAVELINELRKREKFLYEEAANASGSRSCNKIEDYVIGENGRLRGELEQMKKRFGRNSVIKYVCLFCIMVVAMVGVLMAVVLSY